MAKSIVRQMLTFRICNNFIVLKNLKRSIRPLSHKNSGHLSVPASLILAKNVTKEPSCHFLGAVKYQATPVTTEMMIRTSQFGCSCMPRMDIRMASMPSNSANVATVARIAFVRGDQDCIVKTFFPINLSAIVSRFSISR